MVTTVSSVPDRTSVAVCMEPLFSIEVRLFWKLSGVLELCGKMSFLIKLITYRYNSNAYASAGMHFPHTKVLHSKHMVFNIIKYVST